MSDSLEPELLSSSKWRAGVTGTPANFRPGVLFHIENKTYTKTQFIMDTVKEDKARV